MPDETLRTPGRVYVTTIDPALARSEASKPYTTDALKAALGVDKASKDTVRWDPDAQSNFVTKQFIAAHPELDVAKIVAPFQTEAAAAAIAPDVEAIKAARGTADGDATRGVQIPVEDRFPLNVPLFKTNEQGQVALDEKGQPVPEGADGFGKAIREEFGAKVRFMGHLENEVTGTLGRWVVSKAEMDGHAEYGKFINDNYGEAAITRVQAAAAFKLQMDQDTSTAKSNFFKLEAGDVLSAKGRERLQQQIMLLDTREQFHGVYRALTAETTGRPRFQQMAERAQTAYTAAVGEYAARPGGPIQTGRILVNNEPKFNDAEKQVLAEKRAVLQVDDKPESMWATVRGRPRFNPMTDMAFSKAVKHFDTVITAASKQYEARFNSDLATDTGAAMAARGQSATAGTSTTETASRESKVAAAAAAVLGRRGAKKGADFSAAA